MIEYYVWPLIGGFAALASALFGLWLVGVIGADKDSRDKPSK